MPIKDQHEQKFFKALGDIFVGAKIEGDSGFINLMAIKSRYYQTGVFPLLKKDIDNALVMFPDFREELFDKLFTFFQRYFSESGSIYFRYTSLHQNVYEKVYTDDRDVILFWKTHMLYYVKTDRIFRSVNVEVDDTKFFFDASKMSLKKANEKREVIYAFRKLQGEDGTLVFDVDYSERGRVTKVDEILKETKKAGRALNEDTLNQAFRIFEKQSEVDFFINKDARSFLQEQFDLWMYQYLFDGQNIWSAERIAQLQALKEIAYKVIAFISQFEDELVKIWNKPKFVLNSHYVVTIDRINARDSTGIIINKLFTHHGMEEQIKEWLELCIIDRLYEPDVLFQLCFKENHNGKLQDSGFSHLPIDTKHFPSLELTILELFNNIDNDLDGYLIKSDNYQALTSLLNKFKNRIQLIYIDPPFNTGNDFIFVDNYQDSTWATILENRLRVSKDFLEQRGNFYLHLDHFAEHYAKLLLDQILGSDNFRAKITWNTGDNISGFKSQAKNWIRQADFIHYYSASEDYYFKKAFEIIGDGKEKIGWLDVLGDSKDDLYIEVWEDHKLTLRPVVFNVKAKGTIWNDIYSFQYSEPRITESLSFTSNQKPENLLRRIIQTSSTQRSLVLDYYVGSGTTCAVAHKLNRRWIGVEMGAHFGEVYLDEVTLDKDSSNTETDIDLSENNPAIVKVLSETKNQMTVMMKKIGALGRMKIVLNGDKEFKAIHSSVIRHPHLSKDINWEGGGFFKYYDLEQYEDVLRRAKYEDSTLFENPSADPYHSYVFLRDLKMLDSIEVDTQENQVHFHPERLYPDPGKPNGTSIDLAETLSQRTGKWIKRITADYVEFQDGERMSLTDPDWQTIKPLVWWQ